MNIRTVYYPDSFAGTLAEFQAILDAQNQDKRRKKASFSKKVCELITDYVKANKGSALSDITNASEPEQSVGMAQSNEVA